jgi:hypothetical protein
MRSTLALSIAAFAGLCAAQDTTQMDYPYTIDPNTVPEKTRGTQIHLHPPITPI